ncbi:helicase associated domain-containing protein [Gordonia terrae]|uniref:helicase associated domain-containing protein n=1 Tax=Gordonia terrae TaxID=2055 RepID=UPI0030B86588
MCSSVDGASRLFVVSELVPYDAEDERAQRGDREVTINGFPIGAWVDSRRTGYRAGRMSAERMARLESEFPGWRSNVLDAAFASGIMRCFVAVHGTSNARQHDVIEGFAIRQWIANRRTDCRKGRLSAERIHCSRMSFRTGRGTRRTRRQRPRSRPVSRICTPIARRTAPATPAASM